MRTLFTICATATAALLGACTSYEHSCFTNVADIPLKSAQEPGTGWASAPLRSHAMYVMYGAESMKEREARVGDYYFVSWYDKEPQKPVRLVMRYTQAATGADEQRREIVYKEPREDAEERTERFFFAGEERKKAGDILTWRMELYVDGKLTDTCQSYLWE